jgi:predicted DNA-binding transcriptional regulator AlpA
MSDWPPPWVDKATLAKCICAGDTTIDTWVAQGILPPPRKRGGKLMWKWSEVDERLSVGSADSSPDSLVERIRNGSRRAATEGRQGH